MIECICAIYFSNFYSPILSFIKFPGALHDLYEALIGVDGGADVSVVSTEFIKCDNTILDLGIPETHELHVDLVFRFGAVGNLWLASHSV